MDVVIVDYGTGNLRSVCKALEAAGKNLNDFKISISGSPNIIAKADKIILPGQGSYKQCMDSILSIDGLYEELNKFVKIKKRPLFAIIFNRRL